MYAPFERLKVIFLALFAVLTVAMMIWQVGWIWPRQNCEKARKWWDGLTARQPRLFAPLTAR